MLNLKGDTEGFRALNAEVEQVVFGSRIEVRRIKTRSQEEVDVVDVLLTQPDGSLKTKPVPHYSNEISTAKLIWDRWAADNVSWDMWYDPDMEVYCVAVGEEQSAVFTERHADTFAKATVLAAIAFAMKGETHAGK